MLIESFLEIKSLAGSLIELSTSVISDISFFLNVERCARNFHNHAANWFVDSDNNRMNANISVLSKVMIYELHMHA